jgi:hypothetical protein
MEIPQCIANWREWQDDGRLTFQHLRQSSPGRKLMEMRGVRRNAVRPVWFACLLFICRTLCKVPILQRAFCAIFPLFTHVITLTVIAAALLSHKFPSMTVGLRRKAKRALMLVITVALHCICVFHEACRSFPRVTREHYTRTKVRQRRAFQTVRSPIQPKPRKFTRRDRLRAKAQPKSSKARVANIIACLAKDAADSKRKRLGLAPDETPPTLEQEHLTKERSWRNPIADSLRCPKISSWNSSRKADNFSYHALGACFKPYKHFLSLHTRLCPVSKP